MCHSSFNVFIEANLIFFFSCNGLDSQPLRNFHGVQFDKKKRKICFECLAEKKFNQRQKRCLFAFVQDSSVTDTSIVLIVYDVGNG